MSPLSRGNLEYHRPTRRRLRSPPDKGGWGVRTMMKRPRWLRSSSPATRSAAHGAAPVDHAGDHFISVRILSLTSGALVKNFALGGVKVFGALKPATVQSEGLDLRWDFSDLDLVAFSEAARDGLLHKHLQYAFVLKPDGTGLHYDFSMSDDGRAKPSQIFQCLRS